MPNQRHIDLDREDELVKRFVKSLPLPQSGSVLELNGKPVCRVLPLPGLPADPAAITAAIRNRRDRSRELNRDWEYTDREMWDRLAAID